MVIAILKHNHLAAYRPLSRWRHSWSGWILQWSEGIWGRHVNKFCSGVKESGGVEEGILQWSEGIWGRHVNKFCSGVKESGGVEWRNFAVEWTNVTDSRVEELGVVEWRNIAVEWMKLYFWATVLHEIFHVWLYYHTGFDCDLQIIIAPFRHL